MLERVCRRRAHQGIEAAASCAAVTAWLGSSVWLQLGVAGEAAAPMMMASHNRAVMASQESSTRLVSVES